MCYPFCSHGSAGGIYNGGTLTINKSTVSGNRASEGCRLFFNRGIYSVCFGGDGGGIYSNGTLIIYNSTVSGNVATLAWTCFYLRRFSTGDGGGILSGGTLTISSSTISGNSAYRGGGIDGSATLQNSIVAHNTSAGLPNNCSGTMTSNGYNLSNDTTCNFNKPGDQIKTDLKLGTLGYHGGPTQTIPLLSGSPAIDAGNPSGCTDGQGHLLKTDQRSLPRPDTAEKNCDIGAYETQSVR